MPPPPEALRSPQGLARLLAVALALPPLSAPAPAPAHAQGSVATDKTALVALYNATDGANWTTSTNWTTGESLSSWHGVTTDADGRVTAVDLAPTVGEREKLTDSRGLFAPAFRWPCSSMSSRRRG